MFNFLDRELRYIHLLTIEADNRLMKLYCEGKKLKNFVNFSRDNLEVLTQD